jgi:type VI secretion system protein VasD
VPACQLRPPVFFNLLAMLLLATLLAACGAAPPKPTIVQGSVEAGADINPDRRNRASPVTVRIYELKTIAVFERADFFSVWDGEAETLGGDLLGRDEIQLVPGERRQFERTLQPDTRHVAVVAAFRDLERAQWRASTVVIPNRTQTLTISLGTKSVSVSAPQPR